jgi:hypothetical protein
MAKFSYAYITDDATRAIADRIIRQSAMQFVAWRATTGDRAALPREKAFGLWWRTKGPISFTSTADARQYREDVWREALRLTSEPEPATAPTPEAT